MLLLSVSSRRDGRWRRELHLLCFGNGNTFSVFPFCVFFNYFLKLCVGERERDRERALFTQTVAHFHGKNGCACSAQTLRDFQENYLVWWGWSAEWKRQNGLMKRWETLCCQAAFPWPIRWELRETLKENAERVCVCNSRKTDLKQLSVRQHNWMQKRREQEETLDSRFWRRTEMEEGFKHIWVRIHVFLSAGVDVIRFRLEPH